MERKFVNERALLIFLRNPEKGKVKTRLAKDIGDEKALQTYLTLVRRTHEITSELNAEIYPFYNPLIPENSPWQNANAQLQKGRDLGECMSNAFDFVFDRGHARVLIIGSDCYQLEEDILEEAFESLVNHDFVIGPSEDGGYYLLGMKCRDIDLFGNMEWSVESVYENTLSRLNGEKVKVLPQLNDIDTLEDLKKEDELYQYILS
jgi:hypothetical protein